MLIRITGKNIDLGDSLRERVAVGLEDAVGKYVSLDGEASAVVSRPGHEFEVDFSLHLSSGVTLQAHGRGPDAYAAVEEALTKVEKRVRRYKRRLKNHRQRDPIRSESIAEHLIAPDDADADDHPDPQQDTVTPTIVAERPATLKTMTVSMAVMQLELTEGPALLFRNASHGGLNMVYVRSDGHIGWVDPHPNDRRG